MLTPIRKRTRLLLGVIVCSVALATGTRVDAGTPEPQNPPRELFAGPETVVYVDSDAVGSVRMLTDQNGGVVARYDYLPFGTLWDSPALQTSLAFALTERDADTGQDYASARYFQANLGRFTTVDPGHVGGNLFDTQSWNGYAYARNNPLKFIDLSGLEYQICSDACNVISDREFMELSWNPGRGGYFGSDGEIMGYDAKQNKWVNAGFYVHISTDQPPHPGSSDGADGERGRQEQESGGGGTLLGRLRRFVGAVPWAGSVNVPIPLPVSPVGVTVPGALIPGSDTKCIGGGVWLGTPSERVVGGGPLLFGTISRAKAVLNGTSWSFNVQVTQAIGGQVIWNESGILFGPTAALVPGVAISKTVSTCTE